MQLQSPSRRVAAVLAAAATAVAAATSVVAVAAPAGAAPAHPSAVRALLARERAAHLPSAAALAALHRPAASSAARASARADAGPSALLTDPYSVRSEIPNGTAADPTAGLNYVDLTTRVTGTFSQPTLHDEGIEDDPSISHDGKKIAYQFIDPIQGDSNSEDFTVGIAVLTVGSPNAPVELVEKTFHGSSTDGTKQVLVDEPTFSADDSTVYFDEESVTNPGYANDQSATPAQQSSVVTTVNVDDASATTSFTAGGKDTTAVTNAVTPSVDGAGDLVYSDADPTVTAGPTKTDCLVTSQVIATGATTCELTYGQAQAALPDSPELQNIFAPDAQASRTGTGIAISFQDAINATTSNPQAQTVVGLLTPATGPVFSSLKLFSSTVLTSSKTALPTEQQPELDPSGTEVTFVRSTYNNANGSITGAVLEAVDTGTGKHVAAVTSPAQGGGSTLIPAVSTPTPAEYFPLTAPARLLDTRTGAGTNGTVAPVKAGSPIDVQVTGKDAIPSNATAVVLNVGATDVTANTYVEVYPTPTNGVQPLVSNLNLNKNQTIANAATVALSSTGELRFLTAVGSANIYADVLGYYAPPAPSAVGDLFTALSTPVRALDTRTGKGTTEAKIGAGGSRDLTLTGTNGYVPATATSVVVQVGGIGASAPTFLSAYPTPTTTGNTRPTTSTLNLAKGDTRSNLATVTLPASGQIRIYNDKGTVDAYVDVVGYYQPAADGGAGFVPLAPSRLYDSRIVANTINGVPGPIGPNSTADALTAGRITTGSGTNLVPAGATAVQLNVTVPNPTKTTFVSVYGTPDKSATPTFSNVNAPTAAVTATAAVSAIGTGPNGQTALYNSAGDANVVLDLAGYFIPVD